jgi:hypothetical protein
MVPRSPCCRGRFRPKPPRLDSSPYPPAAVDRNDGPGRPIPLEPPVITALRGFVSSFVDLSPAGAWKEVGNIVFILRKLSSVSRDISNTRIVNPRYIASTELWNYANSNNSSPLPKNYISGEPLNAFTWPNHRSLHQSKRSRTSLACCSSSERTGVL